MIDLDNVDLSKLSYREKMEMLEILEELERRKAIGGHLVKIYPEEGPLAWHKYPKHMRFFEAGKRHRERFASYANRALADGTPVLTPSGWVEIQKLKVGDEVFDGLGQVTTVTGVYPQGKKPCYNIKFDDGASVIASGDHLWKAKSKKSKTWEVLSTYELIVREAFSGNTEFVTPPTPETPFCNGSSIDRSFLSLSSEGQLECTCISVESDDRTYITKDFIVTHNTGKTFGLGAYEAAAHLTGLYPDFWPGRKFDKPIDMWAVGTTSQTTRDIIQKELLGPPGAEGHGMIAKDLITGIRKKPGVPDGVETFRVKHVSGGESICTLKAYDQGRRSFEGTAKDFIWLDELPPSDVYGECVIRTMTTGGMVVVTATPVQGLTKFVQEFMENAEKDETPDAVADRYFRDKETVTNE